MLRRLLAGLAAVLLAFATAITLPLARLVADRATQEVYTDRLADADHVAAVAARALADGRTAALADELRRYREVYGIGVWVLGVDGAPVVPAVPAPSPRVLGAPQVQLALAGHQPEAPSPVTPRTGGDLLVAVPVGNGAEVIGAVVVVSPLGRLRARVARLWALLAAVAALVTAVLLAATVPFTRWLLRPVARLDAAAERIAAGRLESRVGPDGGHEAGPPELRRLARSFDRMAAVVERTLQRQQQFVGDASHQLRTPLTSLRLSLENLGALLPEAADHPARVEHREAVEEVRAMGRMFDGLLALTRLGSEPAAAERVDDVLAAARVGWLTRCRAAGLALTVDARPGLVALAPPGGLRHLLDELVENACRLSGGTVLAVTAAPDGAGGVELGVRDDGRGLAADQRAAAVRRFWRAPDQQNTAGSGLGLAIVAELAEAAGGGLALGDAAPGLRVVLRLREVPAPSGLVRPQPGDGGGVQGHRTGGEGGADVGPAAVGMGPEAPGAG